MVSSCGRKRARAQVAKTDASGIRCTKRALRWPDAGASLRSMDSEIALGSAWLSSVELLTEIPVSRVRRMNSRTTKFTARNFGAQRLDGESLPSVVLLELCKLYHPTQCLRFRDRVGFCDEQWPESLFLS
jgi:hypothetical protein